MEPASSPSARTEALVESVLARLDLDTKAALLAGRDQWSLPAVPAVGLASIVMSDGPVGVRGRSWSGDEALALPSPTAQAAGWDVGLAERTGRALAAEARRKGVHVLLAPTINLHRSPLGGRHFEAYSEDPFLTGELAAAFVRGVQSGGVATTVKHFVANDAETERLTVDNVIDERTLREVYLAPFETAVEHGGAWGVMSAYNGVNGPTMTENGALQIDVLRGEWGFDGVVVSDWEAARDTVAAATGGTDVAMPGPDTVYGERLAAAVRDGRLAESVLDERVRAVLRLAVRVGALTGAVSREHVAEPADAAAARPPAGVRGGAEPLSPDPRTTPAEHAREVAARSFVLAKNDRGLLPLASPSSVALIGLPAAEPRVMGGGSAQVFPPPVVSPRDALRAALPGSTAMTFTPALDPRTKLPPVRDGFALAVTARDRDGATTHTAPAAEGFINWLGDRPAGVDEAGLAEVELAGTFTPRTAGRHELAVAGVGDFALTVGGEVRYEGRLRLPEGAHPFSAVVEPPEHRVAVELAADVPVSVSLSCRVDPDEPGVTFRLGHADPLPDVDTGIEQAVAVAAAAEVAIVAVATTESVESEGFDRVDLRLPGRQDELVSRVAAANPRTVVVVTSGAPVEMPWLDQVRAVLLTWFGGQEFGPALAEVLTGAAEPGGRLPTTWPKRLADAPVANVTPANGRLRYAEGRFIGYRAWQRGGTEPALWFGHGLGYTDWRYDEATLAPGSGGTGSGSDGAEPGTGEEALGAVTVRLANTGDRAGREVVQVYLASTAPGDDRPRRWLAGFASVSVPAGGGTEVTISIPRRAAQVWDTGSGAWTTRPGPYRLDIGRSVADIRLSIALTVD